MRAPSRTPSRQYARPTPRRDDEASIPLPDVGTSFRSRRRREQARIRHQRQQGVAAGLAVLVLAGLFLVAKPVVTGGKKKEKAPPVAVAAAPPVLLAVAGADGRASSLTLLVPGVKKGGTVLFIPPGAMTEIASLGLEPVGMSLQLGGAKRLLATVENLIGAGIASVQVVDDDGMAKLVDRSGQLDISIPERVETVEPGGQVNVLYEIGKATVQPHEIPALLLAKGQAGDLSRLARHQAFWNAWFARMKRDPSTIPPAELPLRKALAAMAPGAIRAEVLPVTSMGVSGDEGEIFRVESERLRSLAATILPSAPKSTRPTVQILNGTGEIQLAQRVADKLVPAGLEIRLTGNAASFAYDQTQIVFYRQGKREAAEKVQKAMGVGRLVFSRRPLDVVDVTIIVGKDFRPE